MQALLINILTGILRAALGGLSVWLIDQGIVADDAQWGKILAGLAAALVAAGWTAWDKIQSARKLNTAAATTGKTVGEVEHMVASGTFAPALTPKDQRPVLTSTGDGK